MPDRSHANARDTLLKGVESLSDERYLLRLAEEASEVIQMVSKIFRFGLHSAHPYRPEEGTNIQRLESEIADFVAVLRFLHESGVISIARIEELAERKHDSSRHM